MEERRSDYEDIKITLSKHDMHLDALNVSMGRLTATTDKLTDAISSTGVLVEKVHNMDENLHEGFRRRDAKIKVLEDHQQEMVSSTVIRWALGLFLTVVVVGTGIQTAKHTGVTNLLAQNASEIHRIDKEVTKLIGREK